jgi:2-polyprenyl-3-methyl-5-hydroxy-6-metoxy-1,4-benzoquinol methylase
VTALPTSLVPCPGCGSCEREPFLENAPAQLVDLDQTFTFARCDPCGLVYLRERVDSSAVSALYDADYPLHRGPALWGPFAPLVERDQARVDAARVDVLLEHRAVEPGDTVLDVGCGRPTFLAALRERTGCRALGVDIVPPPDDPRFAGLAVASGAPPDWPRAIASEAPFSAVTLWHYLEHDPAPVDTLRWLAERMRPDGVAVVEVPDLAGSTARWLGRRWPGYHTPRHASVFTAETLARVAARAGWEVACVRRRGTLAPFVLVALAALDGAGFRFGRHSAPLVFPLWAAAMAATWPLLGRRSREGLGLLTAVLRPR